MKIKLNPLIALLTLVIFSNLVAVFVFFSFMNIKINSLIALAVISNLVTVIVLFNVLMQAQKKKEKTDK